jgi:DNA-binding NarL/FixJ family response regulator
MPVTTNGSVRILLVDDQQFVLKALQEYLASEPGLAVVGSAAGGQTAIERVESLQPDIALIDIEMPEMDGLATTSILSKRFPNTKVLVLSSHDDPEYIKSALQVGAKGYLLKTTPAPELVSAIRSVNKGYFQLGPGLFEKFIARALDTKSNSSNILDLLRQEIESGTAQLATLNHRVKELESQGLSELNHRVEELENRPVTSGEANGANRLKEIESSYLAIRYRIRTLERLIEKMRNLQFASLSVVVILFLIFLIFQSGGE